MPALPNPRHEAFAQALASGKTADEAYQVAGYSPNRGNATTLKANQSISKRVAELVEAAASKTVDALSFEAQDLFKRMESLIERAAEANDFKAAIDGQKFVLRCFGYEDSPTLTHEHVKGKTLQTTRAPETDGEDRPIEEARESVVKNFAEELKKLRRRAGS